jgi:hypothetical protein
MDRMRELDGVQYVVRTRIAHTYSKTSGWRHETTVELSSNAMDPKDHEIALTQYMRKADDLARQEARTRNTIDRFEDSAA